MRPFGFAWRWIIRSRTQDPPPSSWGASWNGRKLRKRWWTTARAAKPIIHIILWSSKPRQLPCLRVSNLITLLDSNSVPRLEVAANTTAIYAPNGTLAEVITADGTAYFATNVFITNGVLHLGSASLVLSNSAANTVFYEGGVAVIDLRTNSVTIATNLIVTGTLTGNGAGLTNLPAAPLSTNVTLGNGWVGGGDALTSGGIFVGTGDPGWQTNVFNAEENYIGNGAVAVSGSFSGGNFNSAIEGVVRGFRRAVVENQPRHYKPWTPRNTKWAG